MREPANDAGIPAVTNPGNGARMEKESDSRGDNASEALGAVGGILAGAGLGMLAGPIGAVLGGLAGAAGGWWAGGEVEDATKDWSEYEPRYREHYRSLADQELEYDLARLGYFVGHAARRNPDYRGRTFDEVEPFLAAGWDEDREFERHRPYIHGAFDLD